MHNNILLLFTKFGRGGGAEKHILALAEEFSRKGYKVVSATQGGAGVPSLKERSSAYYKLPDCGNNMINLIFTIMALCYIVKKENIYLIHSHHRFCAFAAWIVSKFIKVKALSTSHNIFQGKINITRWGDYVIAVSEGAKRQVVDDCHFDEEKVVVIYNGIHRPAKIPERDKEEVFQKLNLKEGYPVICNIGRLTEQKGPSIFLSAIEKVVQREPDLQVLMVGEGELRKELEEQARELGIRTNVIFTGFREDIPVILQISQFLVGSALWEGFPYSIIEALANGTPVIATRVGGVPEAVIDDCTGYLVEPNDAVDLADKILYLIRHKEKIEEFGENGRRLYEEKFAFDRMIEQTEKVYQQLLCG